MGKYGSYYVGPLGFLFKRPRGASGHRIFSLGVICNKPQDINNSYVPGSGVGASSTSNRRAKLLHSTKCTMDYPCNKSFSRLGLYAQGGSNDYALNWFL
jgi:hypothetical protein